MSNTATAHVSSPRLLPLRVVKDRTGLSKTTIYRLELAGEFPKRVALTPCRVAWVESEIDSFIAGRIKARDGGINGGTNSDTGH